MRKKYYKPTYRVKDLEQRVLQTGSEISWGGTGPLDAKSCSFEACEEETSEE